MDNREKEEILKSIVRKLHDGVPVEDLKKEFNRVIRDTSPEEIADMENALINEGFPVEEVQRLCDVHVQVFDRSLKKTGKSGKIPGHPVYSFLQENRVAKKILKQLKKASRKLKDSGPKPNEIDSFLYHFNRLKEIEKHYQRKENVLFPLLESRGFTGPTKVMWGKHDEIRSKLKEIQESIENKRWHSAKKQVNDIASAIKKMIFLEEKILYPTSIRKLDTRDWAGIKLGEPEIGYAWISPSSLWDANLAKTMSSESEAIREESMDELNEKKITLSQGQLTREQIDLMLTHLPVDITFVDENNKVCYYSDTQERIFPRSPAIIGREVQNCHPPKSVHVVNDIVENFRKKKKNVAEFWIQMDGKVIYIRYFPVFDKEGIYRGVIEVSQDVSGIKKLEGERRLLDW
jgi:PAS domain S-box-containing protein